MTAQQQRLIPASPVRGEKVFEVDSVTFRRGPRTILSDLSLEVRAGEVLAIVGPNGTGKSTLLGLLSGDLAPNQGEVRFLGQPLSEWSLGELARRRSVLLQDNPMFFPFSVREVVEMGRAPWNRTEAQQEDEAAVIEAMVTADVTGLAHRAVPSLSGGERARTALARVLASRTSTLMLDEPTAALDLGHQERVLQLMRARAEEGAAVLVILHDLDAVSACADQVALLSGGTVAAYGPPGEVLTPQALTEVYGTPVEVVLHPDTGRRVVLPVRGGGV